MLIDDSDSVTSGTGVVGYRVAISLLEAGHKDVRVGVWKGDRQGMDKSFGQDIADILEQKGAEVIEFNWANESGMSTCSTTTFICSTRQISN